MSTYFPTFRRRTRGAESREHEQATSSGLEETQVPNDARSRRNDTTNGDEYVPSTSMLIFPSPSSLPPTPASHSAAIPGSPSSGSTSNFSLPTSISVDSSIFSENSVNAPSFVRRLRLRERPPQHQGEAFPQSSTSLSGQGNNRSAARYPSGSLDVELESASEGADDGGSLDVEVWGWTSLENSNHGSTSQSQVSSPSMHHPSMMQASDFEMLWRGNPRLRTISQLTHFTTASNESGVSYFSHSTATSAKEPLAPAPIHFPLLSWITRFFRIDPETLLILGASGCSSGEESHLFVSTPFDLQSGQSSEEEKVDLGLDRPSMLTLLVKYHSPNSQAESVRNGLQAASEQHESSSDISSSSFLEKVISTPLFIASGAVEMTGNALKVSASAIGQTLRVVPILPWPHAT
ncbi:hypothetical protein FRC17_007531 [Serendipita sp. 399]|nr:hypothetical protein FRC17_007531 [Serendipita sp. 399]